MEKKYDVVVVGAGPAGSVAAMKAAAGGAHTLLIDKEMLPRYKLCGGGVAEWVIRKLNIPEYLLERKYTSISFYTPPRYKRQTFPAGMHWGVSRDRFDYSLTMKAIRAGAEVIEKTHITDVIKTGSGVSGVVTEDGERVRANVVIACDGVYSRIARKAGLWDAWFNARGHSWKDCQAFCIEAEYGLDNAIINERFGKPLASTYVFYTGKDIAPLGYGWIFPKDGLLTVGIGIYEKSMTQKPMAYFDYFMKHPAVVPYVEGAVELVRRGAYIPWSSYPVFTPSFMKGLLVAGDAAGMVSPISGEGIYYAVKAGLLAGAVAVEAVQLRDFSTQFLARYEHHWKQSIGENLAYQGVLFEETIGKILSSPDPSVHLQQYREGLIAAFMRYISYVLKKTKPRKPLEKPAATMTAAL
jgi:digeranylgeranylglycerophospholipid reductase